MTRVAILDHTTHQLFIEDISDKDLQKYGGSEQDYIDDNYTFKGGYSWDYIVDICYFPIEDKTPVEVDLSEF